MKNQIKVQRTDNKFAAILFLQITAILIVLMGVAFSIISVLHNIYFPILSSNVHGSVFGLVVAFLGVRYFLSVQKLKTEVYKSTSQFSWRNFRILKKSEKNEIYKI